MAITGFVKRLAEKIGKQVKSTIKPPSLVFYKDYRPRDANYYHYRYPSPGSTPVGLSSEELPDYRHGYRDSPHNIRDHEHYINESKEDKQELTINPHSKNKHYLESKLNSD